MVSMSRKYNSSSEFKFNHQIPVILNLDIPFDFDAANDPALDQCTEDSRTWQEKILSNIAEHTDLECKG